MCKFFFKGSILLFFSEALLLWGITRTKTTLWGRIVIVSLKYSDKLRTSHFFFPIVWTYLKKFRLFLYMQALSVLFLKGHSNVSLVIGAFLLGNF